MNTATEGAVLCVFALCLFALPFLLCLYVYFGYPALIYVLSRLRARPVARGPVRPSVSLIVAAFNEERVIEDKLRNSLDLDYPPERLEVIVVSDGSTDGTDDTVRGFERAHPGRVRLVRLPRSGKAAALNAGVREATGEILALTDANSALERSSLAHLVENFADKNVGGVCGHKQQRAADGADADADTTTGGENLYWRYDTWQKQLESRLGSIFAADGTLYALRRELYVPIEDPAQADDIAISARIVLQGRRLLYEPRAVAWEDAPTEGAEEFRRKVRVTHHSVRALLNLGPALWRSGFYSVELISHKLLRHLVPWFLIPLLLSNAWLATHNALFRVLLGLQALFYLLAGLGFALRHRRPGRWRPLSIPYYFTLVNAAAFVGVVSILRGRRLETWTPRGGAC